MPLIFCIALLKKAFVFSGNARKKLSSGNPAIFVTFATSKSRSRGVGNNPAASASLTSRSASPESFSSDSGLTAMLFFGKAIWLLLLLRLKTQELVEFHDRLFFFWREVCAHKRCLNGAGILFRCTGRFLCALKISGSAHQICVWHFIELPQGLQL